MITNKRVLLNLSTSWQGAAKSAILEYSLFLWRGSSRCDDGFKTSKKIHKRHQKAVTADAHFQFIYMVSEYICCLAVSL